MLHNTLSHAQAYPRTQNRAPGPGNVPLVRPLETNIYGPDQNNGQAPKTVRRPDLQARQAPQKVCTVRRKIVMSAQQREIQVIRPLYTPSCTHTRPTTVVLIDASTCTRCAECKGSSICVHGTRLVRCKDKRCRNAAGDRSERCIHNKYKNRCSDCRAQEAPVLFKKPLHRVVSLKINSQLGYLCF